MAIASAEEERCVLVGLAMDAAGKDLLNWTLHRAAAQGDRVVAVHIYHKSDFSKTNTLSLIRALDEFLADYHTLCTIKQVHLVGRVVRASSVQKTLVKEARGAKAAAVVVGANKNFSLGGPACLAKYCARKLPATMSVAAVHNGKVIFQREAARLPPIAADNGKAGELSKRRSARSMDLDTELPKAAFQKENRRTPSSVSAASFRSSPEENKKLGWPLLHRMQSSIDLIPKDVDEDLRKLSVVQWAMSLPRRSVHSDEPQAELIRNLKSILAGSLTVRWFRYSELYAASNHFSTGNLIGKGGSSRVFKGCLPGGRQAAIKLSKFTAEAAKNFLREVDIVTKIQYRRVVPLIGVCVEGNNLLAAYSYLPRGSLDDNLHGKRSKLGVPWEKRYKVAVATAEAVAYLHTGCARPVLHRDIKSSNILINDDFEPQLSDFGLAMWAPDSSTAAFVADNGVVGTFGYLAPEYFMYGKVSDKIDVYAFGVVLLELLTGRRPISADIPKGQESLVMWATPLLNRGDIGELLDPKLGGNYDELQLQRMTVAAALCITRSARRRPPMSQIKRVLEGDVDEILASSSPSSEGKGMNAAAECSPEDEAYPWPPSAARVSPQEQTLVDLDDDTSVWSTENSNVTSSEGYASDRWSRSSSFD